jgi:type IV pilus assembly protein PilC
MPTYMFEAMDATGQEIRDEIEAETEDEAQATIRQMGYFVTKLSVKKGRKAAAGAKAGSRRRRFTVGGVGSKQLTTFTRQLSILQDAGLPILRSLRILEQQSKPGRLKNSLMDVCENIESGDTLSEAMSKCPKAFDRLYVNMIKAGEAGGALEIILQRLADFKEKAEALKRKVKGALVYPVMVVFVAVSILTFIMIKIVPQFIQIFEDFKTELPAATQLLITISKATASYWYLLFLVPVGVWLGVKLIRKFKQGRMGWDMFSLNWPVFGMLFEKNTMARATRTLGTLVASGVPILEALNITRETCGNAVFERIFQKVSEAIREGETIAKPLKEWSRPGFHPVAAMLWIGIGAVPCSVLMLAPNLMLIAAPLTLAAGIVGGLYYFTRMNRRIVDDLVVNMVDVGEETGELDTMLYKVADTFDDEVQVIADSLTSLLEPLLIVFLGGAVGFIVISLFLPLVSLIQSLSSS